MKRIISCLVILVLFLESFPTNLVYAKAKKSPAISISANKLTVVKGKIKKIKVKVGPKCKLKKIFITKVSRKKIAKVTAKGAKLVIKGKKVGSCKVKIKVKYSIKKKNTYKKFKIKIKVKQKKSVNNSESSGSKNSDKNTNSKSIVVPKSSTGAPTSVPNSYESQSGLDSDGDGVTDAEEKANGSDYNKKDDTTIDTDKDGLTDYVELYVTKTDINLIDTDDDGLTDYDEAAFTKTDPLVYDSYKENTSDSDIDIDADGLTNKEEMEANSNPLIEDSDGDGLSDGKEVNKYNTKANVYDTDSDGASDNWEVENGYDPLKPNSSFDTENSISLSGNKNAISVQMTCSGDPGTLSIDEITNDDVLNSDIPGFIENGVSLSTKATFDEATVSFTFDKDKLDDEAVPTIYYYDDKTQLLEELKTTVSGNIATTTVKHFSKYILIDKTTYERAYVSDIAKPMDTNASVMDFAFLIDYSKSMDENDPEYNRLSIVNDFIDVLREDIDRATVIKFAAYATNLVPLTTDKEMLKNAVNEITNNDGDSCSSDEAGTNGSDAIHMALEELKESESTSKYIIFLTDGEDTTASYDYESLIETAKESNVKIYSIGMGEADETLLTNIADKTGGKYYAASEIDEYNENDLSNIFGFIEDDTVSQNVDSNGDGISDYFTKLLCEGKLKTGTNVPIFDKCSFEDVQKNDDYDGDGIKNGDEVSVVHDKNLNKVYVKVNSLPTKSDTDEDGWKDKNDNNPLSWDVGDRDLAIFAALAYEDATNLIGKMYTADSIIGKPEEPGEKYYFLNGASLEATSNDSKDSGIANKWTVIDYVNERYFDNVLDKDTLFSATTFQNDNNIVIAYRGTNESIGEWVWNILGCGLLDFHIEEIPAAEYALNIAKKHPNSNIYITGHSLGGYLAQIGAAKLLQSRDVNLKKVAYFNGIGLAFNSLTDNIKIPEKEVLRKYAKDHPLISYEIYGDAVSAIGTHMGEEISYYPVDEAMTNQRKRNSEDADWKSEIGGLCLVGLLGSIIGEDDLKYYYMHYGCKSLMEYFWITHETDSFFYNISQGSRG